MKGRLFNCRWSLIGAAENIYIYNSPLSVLKDIFHYDLRLQVKEYGYPTTTTTTPPTTPAHHHYAPVHPPPPAHIHAHEDMVNISNILTPHSPRKFQVWGWLLWGLYMIYVPPLLFLYCMQYHFILGYDTCIEYICNIIPCLPMAERKLKYLPA